MSTQTNGSATGATVQDHRQKPAGVLPRQLQMWLMVGIAGVILLIILLTGHSQPTPRPQATDRQAQATLPASDRIRAYQQQLADDEARLREVQAQEAQTVRNAARPSSPGAQAPQNDPTLDDQRRREYQSLFADNIALSRRPNGQQPTGESATRQTGVMAPGNTSPDVAALLQALTAVRPATSSAVGLPAVPAPGVAPAAPSVAAATAARSDGQGTHARDENPATGPRLRLLEGTLIESVLLNRLDGTFAGPVTCLVTTPVYSQDRQAVLIPAGARLLGAAAPVQAWGDSRLAVSFHRLAMPDGHTYSLDLFKGLDQIGETGLKDEVNRHYLQVFGAAVAIGALSGLAQYNTRGFDAETFGDVYRQSAGASLASSGTRVLDRYLNVLPTVTIREGFRVKVYLTNDLDLPVYASVGDGGVR
jgi:type IV secretion system protein VirB10